MATTLASLVVRVGADVTGVTAGLNTLDKRMRKIKKEFSSVRDSTLSLQAAFGVLAGATGILFAAQRVFDLGAAVEETASKFRTVFGPEVERSEKFLREFANAAGLTITQGRELLASTAAIGQGLGFTTAASADLSQQVVRTAADLASFNNTQGGAERVTQAIISALNGETEALKESAKVVILQADVMAKAAQMTGKATGEITRQEKALATLALIQERSGAAMGDLARTMDSPANQYRRIRAEVLTYRDSMAHALLPAMAVVLKEFGSMTGGVSRLSEVMGQNRSRIAAWTQFTIEAMKFTAQAFLLPVRAAFNLGQTIGNVLTAAVQALRGNLGGARETLGNIKGDFEDVKGAVDGLLTSFYNMQIASGAAFQTLADPQAAPAAAAAVTELSGALTIANVPFREMSVTLPGIAAGFERAAPAVATFVGGLDDGEQRLWRFRDAVGEVTLGGLDAFVDFASGSGDALRQFVKGAISDLTKLAAKMLVIRGIMSFLPGVGSFLGFGNIAGKFAGGFATGGTIPSGQWGIVGERGPEIVQGPAHVTPMSSGGSDASDLAAAILSRLGAMPPAMSPETAARDRWYRALFAEMVAVGKHDGVRLA